LEQQAEFATLQLGLVLISHPSPEVRRRVARVLGWLDRGEWQAGSLRTLRAIEVLEQIGSPQAASVLAKLAQENTEVRLKEQAREALERLSGRLARAP
jgi:hypothetical protein